MKFVYVLEDDQKFQKDIIEAIQFVEPKIQIRIFSRLEVFVDWMRVMMTEGPAAIAKAGALPADLTQEDVVEEPHQLVLVISKVEFLGAKQLPLLRKSRDLFIQRGICTKEDPTAIVLTAFDDPNFDLKELGDRILNNIIFKPFDRLILSQHITYAIDGRHPPSKYAIANQKTTAVFEMLKEVPCEMISEFGMVTSSNHAIPLGSVAKYYGAGFVAERLRSIMAVCDSCIQHPADPAAFQVALRFFAADPTQISNVRKRVRTVGLKDTNYKWPTPSGDGNNAFNVVVIDPDEAGPSGLGGTLERKFANLKVTHYDHYKSFLLDLDPNQANSKDETPAKPFSSGPEMTFVFDATGVTLMNIEKGNESPITVFAIDDKQFLNKSQWILSHLIDAHKDKFKRLFRAMGPDRTDDSTFLVRADGIDYLLNLVGREVRKDTHIVLKFAEASKTDWVSYLQRTSRLPSKVDVMIVSHRYLGDVPAERWANIVDIIKKKGSGAPRIFLTAAKDFSDAEKREMAVYITDIFYRPVDRGYLGVKFHYLFPFLKVLSDPVSLKSIEDTTILKVANPVKVVELSEAGFVMQYHRAISVGSFREMVLWQPYEIGAPELLSSCNFAEENAGQKGAFNCHFVFFGMTDHFLKNIRVWIRDNYILSKEST